MVTWMGCDRCIETVKIKKEKLRIKVEEIGGKKHTKQNQYYIRKGLGLDTYMPNCFPLWSTYSNMIHIYNLTYVRLDRTRS